MEKPDIDNSFDEQDEMLKSIRISKIIVPMLIGVGVVGYMFYSQFKPEEFAKISWTNHTTFWVGLAVFLLFVRHMAYASRLRILSEKAFSWKKCIELVFIWEFSSAVSPTSVGGSAAALFVLSQEKLSTAKTTTIVLYSAVQDALFFLTTLLGFFLIFGIGMIRPDLPDGSVELGVQGMEYVFMGAYAFVLIYGALFFYGLFIKPTIVKTILVFFTSFKWLKRFQPKMEALGDDVVIASKEMKQKDWRFHVGSILSTSTAWICRFGLLSCLIIALKPGIIEGFMGELKLMARLESMFVIMAGSPTPGAVGVAEYTFSKFVKDYIPEEGLALIVASGWRFMTYYFYLLIGTLIIPNWIRNLINQRKLDKLKES